MIAKGRFRDEVKLSEIGSVADHDIACGTLVRFDSRIQDTGMAWPRAS